MLFNVKVEVGSFFTGDTETRRFVVEADSFDHAAQLTNLIGSEDTRSGRVTDVVISRYFVPTGISVTEAKNLIRQM